MRAFFYIYTRVYVTNMHVYVMVYNNIIYAEATPKSLLPIMGVKGINSWPLAEPPPGLFLSTNRT